MYIRVFVFVYYYTNTNILTCKLYKSKYQQMLTLNFGGLFRAKKREILIFRSDGKDD